MNKEYMLSRIEQRIKELTRRYYLLVNNKNKYGEVIKNKCASVYRSKVKRDIQLLKLLYELLKHVDDKMFITDNDSLDAFHKLVEPMHDDK